MILYSPLDGQSMQSSIPNQARHCFLMTRLGNPVPPMVTDIRAAIERNCAARDITVIDAQNRVTGRDFLLKIWQLIASTQICICIFHEDNPPGTQANLFYEFGVAQGLGKETLIIKSPNAEIPSDFVRSEYVQYGDNFDNEFNSYLDGVFSQADFYSLLSDQLENNPVLALDYLKRAYLITGDDTLKVRALAIVESEGLGGRSKNSVELQAAAF